MISCLFYLQLIGITLALFDNETNINTLDSLSIKSEIILNKYTLIIFYTDKCAKCEEIAPIFILAVNIIKEIRGDIFVGRVNSVDNMQTLRDFDIPSLPTVSLFVNRVLRVYTGNREVLPLVQWVLNMMEGESVSFIRRPQHLQQVLLTDMMSIIGFFMVAESPECKLFQEVVKPREHLSWAIISDKDIFKEYKVENNNHMIMFRQFDDPRIDFTDNFTYENIEMFIKTNSVPLLSLFYDRESKIPETFDVNLPNYLIASLDSTHKKFTLHKMLFQKAAKSFLGKVKFIYMKVDDHVSSYLLKICRMKKEEAPTYVFLKIFPDYRSITYIPSDKKMTSKRVINFIHNVLNGTHGPYIKTEKLHQRWNKYPVKVLVGSNYDEVTQDLNKAVFVDICSEKCAQCVQMRHIWHNLAVFYKDKTDIWIATIDNDKNDIPDLRIESYPTLMYYPVGSKEGIKYEGRRSFKDFRVFVESKASIHNKLNYTRVDQRTVLKMASYIKSKELYKEMNPEDVKLILEEL